MTASCAYKVSRGKKGSEKYRRAKSSLDSSSCVMACDMYATPHAPAQLRPVLLDI